MKTFIPFIHELVSILRLAQFIALLFHFSIKLRLII